VTLSLKSQVLLPYHSTINGHHTKSTPETEMNINVGTADRIIRVVVGVILLALVFVGPQTPWGWIGIVPIATALIGNCPAYSLLGIRTCKKPG
jgi:ABC-type polysaccharide/polyol phosphate export permease